MVFQYLKGLFVLHKYCLGKHSATEFLTPHLSAGNFCDEMFSCGWSQHFVTASKIVSLKESTETYSL